jgi:hypothetical protein
MKRGEVYDARLDPVEGSEQRGSRPVVVVSRDAINESSPIVSAAPCTTYREGRRIYPSQVLVKAPEGGLDAVIWRAQPADAPPVCASCARRRYPPGSEQLSMEIDEIVYGDRW